MQARLMPISFYLIATFIYLTSSADPSRDPPFEENVIRGLAAAAKLQPHFERMRAIRVWNTVDEALRPSSNCRDFKAIELDVYFVSIQLEKLVGFLQGSEGPEWGSWPYHWYQLWPYSEDDAEPFDFVLQVNVPQVAAAVLANRAGDMGPWIWIVLCQPHELNITEPTWFFMATNAKDATAVGATTATVIRNVAPEKICVGPYPP